MFFTRLCCSSIQLKMEDCGIDFIEWFGQDLSMKILICLDDPSDLVRVGAVSSSWRQFVIQNSLCQKLCVRLFPEIAMITDVEVKNSTETTEIRPQNTNGLLAQTRNHRVYSFLPCALLSFMSRDCISKAVIASSTDNYPQESIDNTLESNKVEQAASYWSSKGESDPTVHETLIYNLTSNLCVVTEIHVRPFQAHFQFGFPIYSSKAVRFHLGYPKSLSRMDRDETAKSTFGKSFSADDKYVWTYTSPEFPMSQVSCLQKFQLPNPVLCMGGILQIELLGRVQKQEMDGLYYICVSYVQAVGRPLGPTIDIEIQDASGKCTLKYYPDAEHPFSPKNPPESCM